MDDVVTQAEQAQIAGEMRRIAGARRAALLAVYRRIEHTASLKPVEAEDAALQGEALRHAADAASTLELHIDREDLILVAAAGEARRKQQEARMNVRVRIEPLDEDALGAAGPEPGEPDDGADYIEQPEDRYGLH